MNNTNTILYIPIARDLLTEKRELLAKHGFTFPGDSGHGSFRGVEFTYEYNGKHLILDIKKNTFVPLSFIKSRLTAWAEVIPQEKKPG